MRITLIQMPVTPDKEENLSTAAREITAAAKRGSDMAVLPEMFCCPYDNHCFPFYAEEEGGHVCRALSQMAQKNHIWLVGGTMPERADGRIFNTCHVFDRTGHQTAKYRKIHLFDVHIDSGQHFMESDVLSAGDTPVVFQTEFGPIGLAICFDLRFPALFERTADLGAKAIIVPAAFNLTTGPRHWELLFRSRAVDNQLYTLGVSSARNTTASYVAYGHSIVCDPWGDVIVQAKESACALDVELDLGLVEEVRRQLPVRSARRLI